jgi:hypothetical protein
MWKCFWIYRFVTDRLDPYQPYQPYQVPTSYSLGVVMALCALVCWGSWSVTLVLATGKDRTVGTALWGPRCGDHGTMGILGILLSSRCSQISQFRYVAGIKC